jgi:hypothetical protein
MVTKPANLGEVGIGGARGLKDSKNQKLSIVLSINMDSSVKLSLSLTGFLGAELEKGARERALAIRE